MTKLWVALLLFTGCYWKDNPKYCEGNPGNNCDYEWDASSTCSSNDQCEAPTAVCDLGGTGTCVECTATEASACSGTTPVCSDDHTCTGCTEHAQCEASGACLPDGSCGSVSNVAFVAPTGTANATCSEAQPCIVASALATMRPYVKVTGTIDEAVTISGGRVVTFLGAPGAKLTRTTNGAIVSVSNDSTKLTVYDLSISDAPNSASGIGVVIPTASGSPTVDLHRVTISNNPGGGISASGGTLTVSQSTISGNTGGGISASGGTLTVSQSTISGNTGGGISMGASGVVTITNNFIHHNGNNIDASVGGLLLRPSGASKVEFNTIVDNQANLGAASAGGVFCDVAGFIAANNVIFRNRGGTAGTTQTFGNCAYGNSFASAGASATDNSLGFASPNTQPFDYHLTSSSPASVLDAAGACTGADFDGQQRPQGPGCELGADEVVP